MWVPLRVNPAENPMLCVNTVLWPLQGRRRGEPVSQQHRKAAYIVFFRVKRKCSAHLDAPYREAPFESLPQVGPQNPEI